MPCHGTTYPFFFSSKPGARRWATDNHANKLIKKTHLVLINLNNRAYNSDGLKNANSILFYVSTRSVKVYMRLRTAAGAPVLFSMKKVGVDLPCRASKPLKPPGCRKSRCQGGVSPFADISTQPGGAADARGLVRSEECLVRLDHLPWWLGGAMARRFGSGLPFTIGSTRLHIYKGSRSG